MTRESSAGVEAGLKRGDDGGLEDDLMEWPWDGAMAEFIEKTGVAIKSLAPVVQCLNQAE